MKPSILENEKCPACGRIETISLAIGNTPTVIWCCCGQITVYISLGQKAEICRA